MIDGTTRGVYAIAPTPFKEDGKIDQKSLERLIDSYREMGVDGITVLGLMGEANKLDHQEALELVRTFTARASGMPVIVGVSAPGFATMRAVARTSMEMGAAGVMIAPTPNLKTEDQIVGYYAQAAAAVGEDVPFVLQDYPLVFGVTIPPKTICRIVSDLPSCVMLKHEDWPGLDKISALRRFQQDGLMRPISIMCGNGGLFLDLEMERGANGAMTGYAFPDMLVDVVGAFASGNIEKSRTLFNAHLPLIRLEHQPVVGLAVRKYLFMRRGIFSSDSQRLPGARLSAEAKSDIERILARLAKTDPRAKLG